MTPRRRTAFGLAGVLVLTTMAALLAVPNGPDIRFGSFAMDVRVRLGLDLLGGTQLVYETDMKDVDPANRDDELRGVRDVIERRINPFGISEQLVQTTGSGDNGRILVELPGVQNATEAIQRIGETPQLDFREESDEPASPPPARSASSSDAGGPSPDVLPEPVWKLTTLSGRHLKRADVSFHPQTGAPEISLTFDDEGTTLFADVTGRNIGKRVAIFLDGLPITAPVVQDKITQGQAVITGDFTIVEARQLAGRLRAGALPVPISLASRTTIGPSLGHDSLSRSLIGGIIGLFFVCVYMIVLYRLPGVIASLALILYALLNIALFKLIGVTLTLSGIAGFILSIGMAVDANILIFERLKEELRRGRPLLPAISEAFREAWSSIRDSNISSLITCVLLYMLGSSIVRGFAVTLGVGILLSMFSAITITRTLLRASAMNRALSRTRWYASGIPESSSSPSS